MIRVVIVAYLDGNLRGEGLNFKYTDYPNETKLE